MEFHESPQKIIPAEYDIFIGIDVDKASNVLTAIDHWGEEKRAHVPYQGTALIRYLGRHFSGKRVVLVYEAGPTGYGLYDSLRAAGYMCMVTAPALVPQVPGRRVKTNRVDSRQLALRLRGGELEGIRVPCPRYRLLRHLVQQWNQLGRRIRRTKCQIKSLLLLEGIPFPGRGWSGPVRRRLLEMPVAPVLQFILTQQVALLEWLQQERMRTRRRIRAYCRSDEEMAANLKYVCSIPGIGEVTGFHVLARIGNWQRLKKVGELADLWGLSPWERSTGDRVVKGGISRTGDRQMRSLLVEAAWTTIRYDPELAAFWRRLVARSPVGKGSQKAIVAVARKLTVRIYRVLRDQREYEIRTPTKEEAASPI
jgi:transposase